MKLTGLFRSKGKKSDSIDINQSFESKTSFQVLNDTHRTGVEDRGIWVKYLSKIIDPVIENMANETLKENMPQESSLEERAKFAHLEAVGRTVCGIGSWLELGSDSSEEGKLRKHYTDLLIKGLNNITNPDSNDYLVFEIQKGEARQPLVDAAHLAEGLLRGKNQIWKKMDNETQELVLNALIKTRKIEPWRNNWVLFPSMIEAFILDATGDCDYKRLTRGIDLYLNEWYVGDSYYKDGDLFHMDFYNSYVIHPMLVDTLKIMKEHDLKEGKSFETEMKRLSHYSGHLERLISPEGTYPLIGRSMLYRTAVFQALNQSALFNVLPEDVKPAQVRCGLTKVILNQFSDNSNFDENGWLRFGFNGNQKDVAEYYSNTGSMYLCTTGFLALGLSEKDEFWKAPYEEWTSLKAWTGKQVNSAMYIKD